MIVFKISDRQILIIIKFIAEKSRNMCVKAKNLPPQNDFLLHHSKLYVKIYNDSVLLYLTYVKKCMLKKCTRKLSKILSRLRGFS